MNKSFLVAVFVLVVFSFSFVQAQLGVPTVDDVKVENLFQPQERTRITDFIDDFSEPHHSIILNEYEIIVPEEKNYGGIAIKDYVSVNEISDSGEVVKKYDYGKKPTVLRSKTADDSAQIRLTDKYVNLEIENVPYNTPEIHVHAVTKDIIPYFTSGWSENFYIDFPVDGTYEIPIEGFTSYDEPFKFDLIVVARVHTEESDQYYIWIEKVDLSITDEEYITVNFEDNEIKELETNVYDIMENLGYKPWSKGFHILFKETNKAFLAGIGYSHVKGFEMFLKHGSSWGIHQYGIPVGYGYSDDDEDIAIHVATEYDYPFEDLNDYVNINDIKKLTFYFNEFESQPPMVDTIFWGNYHAGYDIFGSLHGTMFGAGWGSAMNFDWWSPEDESIVEFYFRDISECFFCGIVTTPTKQLYDNWDLLAIFDAQFTNGNQYPYPMEINEETDINVFEDPITLDTLISEYSIPSPQWFWPDRTYFNAIFRDKKNHAFKAYFKGPPMSKLEIVALTLDEEIIIYDGYNSYSNFMEYNFPSDTEAIHTTWYTTDLFNPDICLESLYEKQGDEWLEIYKRTGISMTVNYWDWEIGQWVEEKQCMPTAQPGDSGSISPGGWATGQTGVQQISVILVAALAIIVIYAFTSSRFIKKVTRRRRKR